MEAKFYAATQDGNLLTTKRATFYKANLVLVVPHKVSEITKGQSIAERLGDEEGKCPDCGQNKWWLLPKECVVVRTGGKPYIECLECGYTTHL